MYKFLDSWIREPAIPQNPKEELKGTPHIEGTHAEFCKQKVTDGKSIAATGNKAEVRFVESNLDP